jgi:hypothetical protein
MYWCPESEQKHPDKHLFRGPFWGAACDVHGANCRRLWLGGRYQHAGVHRLKLYNYNPGMPPPEFSREEWLKIHSRAEADRDIVALYDVVGDTCVSCSHTNTPSLLAGLSGAAEGASASGEQGSLRSVVHGCRSQVHTRSREVELRHEEVSHNTTPTRAGQGSPGQGISPPVPDASDECAPGGGVCGPGTAAKSLESGSSGVMAPEVASGRPQAGEDVGGVQGTAVSPSSGGETRGMTQDRPQLGIMGRGSGVQQSHQQSGQHEQLAPPLHTGLAPTWSASTPA